MKPSGRLVLPGDEVAVAEEFESGGGTYEEGGRVYAAQPGHLELDSSHRVARVVPLNPPARPQVDDLVYAVVEDMRSSMVEARVEMIHGRKRQVAGEISASLHVSQISSAYTEDPRDAMRLGDIIRARVIQTDPSLQITTAEANLGVVLALCSNCRGPMERRGNEVRCPRCERVDPRKLAKDYGSPELAGPIEVIREPEGSRGPRPERERGGRGGGPSRRDRGGRDGRRPPPHDRRR